MIDPPEKRHPLFSTLPNATLYAVLASVGQNGELLPSTVGMPQGTVIRLERCDHLAANLWIAHTGILAGTVLQTYSPGAHLLVDIGRDPGKNPFLEEFGAPTCVVSVFTCGITAADRAMAQAMQDELGDIEYMHALDEHSNGALAHALYTDLRETVSLEEHLANIHELESFAAASTNAIGNEIRKFLSALRNPRDKDRPLQRVS